jgi:16S rRNA (cytosine967-C5)-methyltransferase
LFDTVLVDVPCTGTGTIAQNPELRYFLEPSDFERLANKQLRILENASKCVKPGGRLIYSTCSLEEEENEGVANRFADSTPGFRSEPPRVPGRYLSAGRYARTVPYRDGTSGFFLAAFRRSD